MVFSRCGGVGGCKHLDGVDQVRAFAFLVVMVGLISAGCEPKCCDFSYTPKAGVVNETYAGYNKVMEQSFYAGGGWVEVIRSNRRAIGDICFIHVGDELVLTSTGGLFGNERFRVVNHDDAGGYGTGCDTGDIVTRDPRY